MYLVEYLPHPHMIYVWQMLYMFVYKCYKFRTNLKRCGHLWRQDLQHYIVGWAVCLVLFFSIPFPGWWNYFYCKSHTNVNGGLLWAHFWWMTTVFQVPCWMYVEESVNEIVGGPWLVRGLDSLSAKNPDCLYFGRLPWKGVAFVCGP